MLVLAGCNTISNGFVSPNPSLSSDVVERVSTACAKRASPWDAATSAPCQLSDRGPELSAVQSSEPKVDLATTHLLALDDRGRMIDYLARYFPQAELRVVPGPPHLDDVCRVPNQDAGAEQIAGKAQIERICQQIVDQFRDRPKSLNLLLFFHGGLVSAKSAIERMDRDTHSIESYPLKGGEETYYPIFVSWPTDLARSYLDTLGNYLQGFWEDVPAEDGHSKPVYVGKLLHSDLRPDNYANWLAPYRFFGDLIDAGLQTPIETAKLTGRAVEFYANQRSPAKQNALCSRLASSPHIDPSLIHCRTVDKGIDDGLLTAVNRATFWLRPLEIGPVKVVGRRAWKGMLGRASFASRTPCRVPTNPGFSDGECSKGGVAMLFDMLSRLYTDRSTPLAGQFKITIIGHSMGTMVENDAVDTYPCLPYENIVLMGAALSIRDFNRGIAARVARRPQECAGTNGGPAPQIYNLSLYPEAESESKERWGLVPAGSLLAWIDDLYEDPDSLDGRTLGAWLNVAAALNCAQGEGHDHCGPPLFPAELIGPADGEQGRSRARLHLTRFGTSANDPLFHGDFGLGDGDGTGNKFHYWAPCAWDHSEVPGQCP